MSPFDDAVLAQARVMWQEQQRAEIERAIKNVRRSDWDKWFRREWRRAAAIRKWTARRSRLYVGARWSR
jgi:hypothetical protein